jgi:hypothetical protein
LEVFFNVMVVGTNKPKRRRGRRGGRERGKALLLQLSNFGTELAGRGGEGGGELLELREIESLESEFGAFLFQRWLVQVKSSFWEIGRSW